MSEKNDFNSFPKLEDDIGPKNMQFKFFDYLNNLSKSICLFKLKSAS